MDSQTPLNAALLHRSFELIADLRKISDPAIFSGDSTLQECLNQLNEILSVLGDRKITSIIKLAGRRITLIKKRGNQSFLKAIRQVEEHLSSLLPPPVPFPPSEEAPLGSILGDDFPSLELLPIDFWGNDGEIQDDSSTGARSTSFPGQTPDVRSDHGRGGVTPWGIPSSHPKEEVTLDTGAWSFIGDDAPSADLLIVEDGVECELFSGELETLEEENFAASDEFWEREGESLPNKSAEISNQLSFGELNLLPKPFASLGDLERVRRKPLEDRVEQEQAITDMLERFSIDESRSNDLIDPNDYPNFDDLLIHDLEPPPDSLLPEGNQTSIEKSGLLTLFKIDEPSTPAPESIDSDEDDFNISIEIEPLHQLSTAEQALIANIELLQRILLNLLNSLDLVLTLQRNHELINIARQFNRIARILGLFQLDHHLAMIAYLQNILPLTSDQRGSRRMQSPLVRLLDPARLASFDPQELLNGTVAFIGYLVEDIPRLERELYERTFLSIYESLGTRPKAPSVRAPGRNGWQEAESLRALVEFIDVYIVKILDDLNEAFSHASVDGYLQASQNLLRLAEALAEHAISDVLVHTARLSEFLRRLRPTDPPIDKIQYRMGALFDALERSFNALPFDRYRVYLDNICANLALSQRKQTDKLTAIPLHSGQRISANQRWSEKQQKAGQTDQIASELLQLVAHLDAFARDASVLSGAELWDHLHKKQNEIRIFSRQARNIDVRLIVLALEVVLSFLSPNANSPTPPIASPLLISQEEAIRRLRKITALAMEEIDHIHQSSSPFAGCDAYFLFSNPPETPLALLLNTLHESLDEILLLNSQAPDAMMKLLVLRGLGRLEQITMFLGEETLRGKVQRAQQEIENARIQLASPLPELIEELRSIIPRMKASSVPPSPTFNDIAQRWILRVRDEVDITVSRDQTSINTTLLQNMVQALEPLARESAHLPSVTCVCLLKETTTWIALGEGDWLGLLEETLYWFDHVLATNNTLQGTPASLLASFSPHDPVIRTSVTRSPSQSILSFQSILEATQRRLEQRAAVLGHQIRVQTKQAELLKKHPLPRWMILGFLGALEELAVSLVDHAWRVSEAKKGRLTLSFFQEDEALCAQLRHDGKPLTRERLEETLQRGKRNSSKPLSPEALLDLFIRYPPSIEALPEGPSIAVAAAQLRSVHGMLQLRGGADDLCLTLVLSNPRKRAQMNTLN